jgi:hypothetical protein
MKNTPRTLGVHSMWSKTIHGDLKDGVVMIPFNEMTHVFQTLDLALNEPIQ